MEFVFFPYSKRLFLNYAIMEEFTISFRYKNTDQKVGILRTDNEKGVQYNVRPIAPEIVKKFGKQIRIYRNGENYKIQHLVDLEDKEFYSALIDAIHSNEPGQSDRPVRIMINKH